MAPQFIRCVHCKTKVSDPQLRLPRSGAQCPKCKKDPTEGWSPYPAETAKDAQKAADELDMRLMVKQDFAVREAALWFLEDKILEQRHEVSIRMGAKPAIEHKCSVCGNAVPAGEGFRLEIGDRWRSTRIVIGLCERHLSEGLYGREFDIHANHPDAWLTRGDWHYANDAKYAPKTEGKEKAK
jgi:hypothetical protein